MLTISKAAFRSASANLPRAGVHVAGQNYWKQGDRTLQGEWHGKLAEKFGLSGAVDAEEFRAALGRPTPAYRRTACTHRAVHEYEGADGKTVASVEHRAGWDATFSAPKSVSLDRSCWRR